MNANLKPVGVAEMERISKGVLPDQVSCWRPKEAVPTEFHPRLVIPTKRRPLGVMAIRTTAEAKPDRNGKQAPWYCPFTFSR